MLTFVQNSSIHLSTNDKIAWLIFHSPRHLRSIQYKGKSPYTTSGEYFLLKGLIASIILLGMKGKRPTSTL